MNGEPEEITLNNDDRRRLIEEATLRAEIIATIDKRSKPWYESALAITVGGGLVLSLVGYGFDFMRSSSDREHQLRQSKLEVMQSFADKFGDAENATVNAINKYLKLTDPKAKWPDALGRSQQQVYEEYVYYFKSFNDKPKFTGAISPVQAVFKSEAVRTSTEALLELTKKANNPAAFSPTTLMKFMDEMNTGLEVVVKAMGDEISNGSG